MILKLKDSDGQESLQIGKAAKFSKANEMDNDLAPAPKLGEHTEEILDQIGINQEERAALKKKELFDNSVSVKPKKKGEIMPEENKGMLCGVKVLDFTLALSGPFVAWNLADWGADVYKVERLYYGDQARHWDPILNGLSTLFVAYNKNKKV